MKKKATIEISNCSIVNQASQANEHTQACVIAIAHAVSANARALEAAVRAMEGSSHMKYGICVGNPDES